MSGKPAYYNENDTYAAAWLRNLISAGLIAPGDVDERSIEDVSPDDLKPYAQCHFFAGIGIWSLALRRAGWDDSRPIWTGSCPCQPFSATGQGGGFADERHLWPAFHHLIAAGRPDDLVGEQVASSDADPWIDLVQTDLEALDYAFGAVAFPSAGVGAPHIRDRAYWGATRRLDHAHNARPQRHSGHDRTAGRQGSGGPVAAADLSGDPRATNGFWRDADWLKCRDGNWRAVQPGTFPLADGIAGRVGRVRAYGNAINVEAAEAFIRSFEEARADVVLRGSVLMSAVHA